MMRLLNSYTLFFILHGLTSALVDMSDIELRSRYHCYYYYY